MELKCGIDAVCPALKAENPGSRWPKTSLAALRDRARLTPEQLQMLNTICAEESEAFAAASIEHLGVRCSPADQVIVDRASIAVYGCRSLEGLLCCRDIPFAAGPIDGAAPVTEDHRRVLNIVAEANDHDYWFAASRDGNREAHYRGPHVGATLMHRPQAFSKGSATPSPLVRLVRGFQERVERELPSMYVWFAEQSLHVTLRALES